jgi:hypothetical protein
MRESDSRFSGLEQGKWAFVYVALIIAWAIVAWPWLSGRVTIPWDAKAHFLPQLQFLADSFAKGESPFWTPFVFSGHPQIADPQSLIFSPPFVLMAYFDPTPTAWAADATLFAMLLVSACAMVLWLSDKGWHPAAALLSALSFVFGAAMAWRVQHVGQVMSLAYLPIVLLCLDRALVRQSVGYAIAAGVVAAFLVLGRDQVALLSIYFLIGSVVAHWLQNSDRTAAVRSSIKPLAIASVSGLAIIAIPIVLTILVAADSNRPVIDLEGAGRGSLHPAHGFTLFAPDVFHASGAMGEYWGPPSSRWGDTGLFLAQNMGQLYLGALPALLLIWGLASGTLWQREARVFSIALVLASFYALGWYTPIFSLMHAVVPGVDLYRRPADSVFVIGFLASVLAGYTLQNISEQPMFQQKPSMRAVALTFIIVNCAFAIMIALAVQHEMTATVWQGIGIPAALFAMAAVVLLALPRLIQEKSVMATALVAIFLTADLAWSNGPGNATALPPETYAELDPASQNETIAFLKQKVSEGRSDTRRDRIELVGFGFHWPNASLTHGLENTLGYNPLRLGHYARATGAGDHVGLPDQKNFSALFPSYRSPLADLLGLRYIASSVPIGNIDKALGANDLQLIARTKDGYVYENTRALPRVMFATQSLQANFDTLMDTGQWPEVDFNTQVVLQTPPDTQQRAPGRVRITTYNNTSVTIDVDSPDGGWVVLNDIWQPWWFASLDGADTPLLRANAVFRAVAVPPGQHRVTFAFEPVRGAIQQMSGGQHAD